MSDTAKTAWITRVLGFDRPRPGSVQRRDAKAQAAVTEISVQAGVRNRLGDTVSGAALGGVHGTAQTNLGLAQNLGDTKAGYSALGTVKQDARDAIPKAVKEKQIEGARKALPKFIENAQEAVDELLADRKKSVQKKGADYQKRLDKLNADVQATTATTPKKELDRLQSSIESLLADALRAGYGKGFDEIIKDRRAKAYKDALEARYGFKTEASLESCQRLAKVLEILPDEHLAHSSLIGIKVSDGATSAVGDFSKSGKKIRLDAGKIKEHPKFEYVVDGKKTKVDTFTVATLHEVGHSVDDRAGIMAPPACSAANYGGWGEKTDGDVADDFWAELQNDLGPTLRNDIRPELLKAVDDKAYSQPAAVSDPDWAIAEKTLAMLKEVAADPKPWKTVRAVIGDRVYHKHGSWVTYSQAARNSQFVRDYQWYTPGEWFAELYAISWLTKKKPSGNIAPAATEFMYRGKP
jgi:hypothetical protein